MADTHRRRGFATTAIHAGYSPDPATGAVNAPIYASSTFAQDGVGGLRGGFEYARTGNPTRAALERVLAALAVTVWLAERMARAGIVAKINQDLSAHREAVAAAAATVAAEQVANTGAL